MNQLEELGQMQHFLRQAEDREHASKIGQLLNKLSAGRVNIAFCGHFSAGKSTLINRLCGHALLPSSPIPTSANIVSIRNGEPAAFVSQRTKGDIEQESEEGVKHQTMIPLTELESYAVNGTDIESVEITYPLPFLGDHAALLDTPGIDSTDDAHQQSTQSALHLADVVFYVMDYNHVQSEVNLAFTKKMKEWGKPLYLVINMIDKHKEQELPFELYREGTKQAFLNWGIEPDGWLYVTMKESSHPHNEYAKLRWLLGNLIERGDALQSWSIAASMRYLAAEHGKWLAEQNEPRREELMEQISQESDTQAVREQADAVQRELERLGELPTTLTAELRKEVGVIIENANITPALTRDRAQAYLESRKPGFKAGFLASAAKTAVETAKRLQTFRDDLAEQMEAQLDWHLRDALKKAAQRQGLHDASLLAEMEALKGEATPQWLAEQVNTGAVFGNEYTLNYMKEVAADIKQQYRKQSFAVIDRLASVVRERSEQASSTLAEERAALGDRLSAYSGLQRLEAAEAAAQAELLQIAARRQALPPELPDLQQFTCTEAGAETASVGGELHATSMGVILKAADVAASAARLPAPPAEGAAPSAFAHGENAGRMERKAAALRAASTLIDDLPSMRSIARSMRDKAERLRERTFTIALFGAFSAGKSSFANALVGERMLPASPNPTTAAINKIMPPQEDWPHGSAKVTMKTREAVVQDVLYSLELLGASATDMPSALKRIASLSPADVTAKGKPHYSFLKAVEKGWSLSEPFLGSELKITQDDFPGYAADESKSCFVEFIELFYANPLTEQGVVLVDTPGADSIHARHTNVAFNYIKNADAILFVTYYNHAFSQADREFLLQLGRVKDSFEMDKMFFIVNAADLAASMEELDGVIKHVETNLIQHGIRNPRIYPISSYLAVEGKMAGDEALIAKSGVRGFEKDFIHFIFNELGDVAIHAADLELGRAIQTMQQWLENARVGEERRRQQISLLQEAQQAATKLLEESEYAVELKEMSKEIQELLYYVKQRTLFRFGELYNYAFNPSSFREEAGDLKQALQSAWNELLRMIAFDLSQEVLATTLRVENKMNSVSASKVNRWEEQISGLVEGFASGTYEPHHFTTPEVSSLGVSSNLQKQHDVSVKLLQSYFKNAKQFFEGDGKSKLRAELESRMNAPIAAFIEKQAEELEQAYEVQLVQWLLRSKALMQERLKEHTSGVLDALEMKMDLNELIAKQQQLKAFMD